MADEYTETPVKFELTFDDENKTKATTNTEKIRVKNGTNGKFSDLTPAEKESLKGDKGDPGATIDYINVEEYWEDNGYTYNNIKWVMTNGFEDSIDIKSKNGKDAELPAFKTINNKTIVGEGNIEIKEGSSGGSWSPWNLQEIDHFNEQLTVNDQFKIGYNNGNPRVDNLSDEILLVYTLGTSYYPTALLPGKNLTWQNGNQKPYVSTSKAEAYLVTDPSESICWRIFK